MSYENYADQEQEEVEAPLRAAKQAVIEAAERYRIELAGGYDGEAAGAHKKLLLAVETLAELKEK